MNQKKRCPCCGFIGYRKRIVRHEQEFDGKTGKILSEHGDDYSICPGCGIPYGTSYGAVYLREPGASDAGNAED